MKKGAILLVFSLLLIGCKENIQSPEHADKSALQKNSFNYSVHLSGGNEVPPVETPAQGQAIFRLNRQGTELYYKLIVANLSNIVQAHIHLGAPGQNGGVVAWLFPSGPFPPNPVPPVHWIEGRFSGVLAEGILTDADLVGALAGMTLADLIEHFDNHNAYVNVHTNDFVDPANTGPGDFPGGEVRGNF
jgi:hypothetical protein